MPDTYLTVRCYCGKDLGKVPGHGSTGITHRPCPDCCCVCGRKVGEAQLQAGHMCAKCAAAVDS